MGGLCLWRMVAGGVGMSVVRVIRLRNASGGLCRLMTPLIVDPRILGRGCGCPFQASRRCR